MAIRWYGLILVLLPLLASPAHGQLPRLEVEPYLGAYVPVTDVIDGTVTIPGGPVVAVTTTQKEGFAFGGRLSLGLFGPVAIEGNALYAFSDVESQGFTPSSTDAYVWAADARLLLRIGLPAVPISLQVGGGIALVGRGGDAYDDVTTGKTDVGGAVGVGMRVKLPGVFAIRLDADGYLYQADLTIQDVGSGAELDVPDEFQADLVVSAGLVIGLF